VVNGMNFDYVGIAAAMDRKQIVYPKIRPRKNVLIVDHGDLSGWVLVNNQGGI